MLIRIMQLACSGLLAALSALLGIEAYEIGFSWSSASLLGGGMWLILTRFLGHIYLKLLGEDD